MFQSITLPVLVLCTLLLGVLSLQQSFEAETQALKEFKSSITNDPSNVLIDWNNTNHHCNWSGIACDPSSFHVISISLIDKQLEGSISPWDLALNSLNSYFTKTLYPVPFHLSSENSKISRN
ncbi:hypothetical protein ACJIZ3_008352 [Penstemon smallii]|uniref:Leucine-rich repeat-containing N-terminal plant-type domain-containing protein n=1 Tax=Penstemon smallii TaxID=265156 RepID=A0ABD3T9H4_9LAMI